MIMLVNFGVNIRTGKMTPEEFKQKHDEYFKENSDQIAIDFYNSMLKS